MSRQTIYFDASDFIRKREFPVNVPAFYSPNMPDHITGQQTPRQRVNPYRMVSVRQRSNLPFRHVPDPKQLQYACYSIEVMIDMVQKKVEFIILNDDDMPEILDGLDRYLLYLKTDVEMGDENIITYVKKVLVFREMVYKHYFRFMKMNPAALEGIYPNGDPEKNIFSLLSIGCRKENLRLDPLAARAYPPYDLAATIPKSSIDTDDNDGFESRYGVKDTKTSGVTVDDGKDFDFNSFLSRGR